VFPRHSLNNAAYIPETPTDILSYRNVEMPEYKIVMVMGIILKRIVTDFSG
jgi:Na+/glutamate symporter